MIRVLLLLTVLLAAVPAVLAGGWATVTLDELPGDVRAGEPFTVGFLVMQHGITPVHDLGEGYPIEPLIVATNPATGERVEVVAEPAAELGHFTAELTLPSEGAWAWSITPRPFGEQLLEPLTVLPAPQASLVGLLAGDGAAATGGIATLVLLRWAGLALVAVGLAVFLWQRRRPAPAASAVPGEG
jgi:hypothetical protein